MQCSPEEYARSSTNPESLRCLSRGDSIGLTIIVEASLLSLSAILYVVFLIFRKITWRFKHLRRKRLQIFHHPMDLLMFSLFFADTLQAIGGAFNLRWVESGKIEQGNLCKAQGTIKNIGETGTALSVLAIAVFTFLGVWAQKEIKSMRLTVAVLIGIWSLIAILLVVGNTVNHNFVAPIPYWCWVNQSAAWKISTEYLWLWLAQAVSLLVYTLLYFWMRGNIFIHDQWWKFNFQSANKLDLHVMATRRKALVMAAYPFVYALTIIPLTIIRWLGFGQEIKYGVKTVPAVHDFVALTLFGLSGFFNVILLLNTRPDCGLFGNLMFAEAPAGLPSPLPLSTAPERVHDNERLPDQ